MVIVLLPVAPPGFDFAFDSARFFNVSTSTESLRHEPRSFSGTLALLLRLSEIPAFGRDLEALFAEFSLTGQIWFASAATSGAHPPDFISGCYPIALFPEKWI